MNFGILVFNQVEEAGYGNGQNDFDPDSDFDLDKEQGRHV